MPRFYFRVRAVHLPERAYRRDETCREVVPIPVCLESWCTRPFAGTTAVDSPEPPCYIPLHHSHALSSSCRAEPVLHMGMQLPVLVRLRNRVSARRRVLTAAAVAFGAVQLLSHRALCHKCTYGRSHPTIASRGGVLPHCPKAQHPVPTHHVLHPYANPPPSRPAGTSASPSPAPASKSSPSR